MRCDGGAGHCTSCTAVAEMGDGKCDATEQQTGGKVRWGGEMGDKRCDATEEQATVRAVCCCSTYRVDHCVPSPERFVHWPVTRVRVEADRGGVECLADACEPPRSE